MNSSKWLLLIPTEFERKQIAGSHALLSSVRIELCGFGPIVPAARATSLIERYQPEHVILCGIAGCYGTALRVGAAYDFANVACYGVGVGNGLEFQTAQQMGWHHWLDSNAKQSIGDKLPLAQRDPGSTNVNNSLEPGLLTVCAASGGPGDVAMRTSKFPDADAEDMEGFAVAAACRLKACPLSIVRGISNRAGDRNHQNWKVREAMDSAVELVSKMIGTDP